MRITECIPVLKRFVFPSQLENRDLLGLTYSSCMCSVQWILITPTRGIWIRWSWAILLGCSWCCFAGRIKALQVSPGQSFQTLPNMNVALRCISCFFSCFLLPPGSGRYTYGDDEDWYSHTYRGNDTWFVTATACTQTYRISLNLTRISIQ